MSSSSVGNQLLKKATRLLWAFIEVAATLYLENIQRQAETRLHSIEDFLKDFDIRGSI